MSSIEERIKWLEEQTAEYDRAATDCAARARRFREESQKLRMLLHPLQNNLTINKDISMEMNKK